MAGTPRRPVVVPSGVEPARVDTSRITWERTHHDFAGAQSMFYLATDGTLGASGAFFVCKPPRSALLRIEAEQDTTRGSTVVPTNVRGKQLYPIRVEVHAVPDHRD